MENEKNIIIIKAKAKKYSVINTYHLFDKRIDNTSKNILTTLLCLNTEKFKITNRATANFFNISTKTFFNHIHELEKNGYILIHKIKNNKAKYEIFEEPIINEFNIKQIKEYPLRLLKVFYENRKTPKQYLKLIKKCIDLLETKDKEIEDFYKENNIKENEIKIKDDELPF